MRNSGIIKRKSSSSTSNFSAINEFYISVPLSRKSYRRVVREEASQHRFDISTVEVREGEDYSCKPGYLVITNTIYVETKLKLLTVLEQIKFTQLDLKVINLSGKGRGLWFFFKKCFKHNMFTMSFVYYLRYSSLSCIVSNIITLYLCLLPDIMKYIPFWFPFPWGSPISTNQPEFNQ